MQMPSVTRIASSAISLAESSGARGQRPRRSHSEGSTRPNRHDAVVRLHEVPVAGKEEHLLLVGNNQEGIEVPQHPVGAPVLCELHTGPFQIASVPFQLRFELRKQRLRVRGGSRETGQHRPFAHAAQLAGAVLYHDIAERDLSVGCQNRAAVATDGQNGGCVKGGRHGLMRSPRGPG